MTHSIENLHVYLRSIKQGDRTSLSMLADLVRAQASVLDLGCGSGALGQYLLAKKGCTVDGVTLSTAEAVHARPYYRRVLVDNLESCDLLNKFADQRYDYIVCADVLEHLSRPERVLDACRELLAPTGKLLISVPNAGYSGLIAELLQGEFRYREEGLLDRTHLRFFTRRSLARFLQGERWALEALDTITRELPDSEFQVAFDSLPPAVARHLLGAADALTYQFIGVARPVAQGSSAATALSDPLLAAPVPLAHARFTAQLYLGQDGSYTEGRKLTSTGLIGQERQVVRFDLPRGDAPFNRLRLDPADRPGFLHLYALTLRHSSGTIAWQWRADAAAQSLLSATRHSQMLWHAPLPAVCAATLVLLSGDDPWFELPIAPQIVAACAPEGAVLEMEVGWPMSADYLALSGTVQPLNDRIGQLQTQLLRAEHQWSERLEQARTDAQQVRSAADQAALRIQNEIDQANSALARASSHNALLEERNQATTQERVLWQNEATRLQRDIANLVEHLNTIENSTVFRATRPLVKAKMRLDRLLGRGAASLAAAAIAPLPTPIKAPAHPVDVIVPVYRGLADTRLCIDSVLASACATPYRLIVINDASPEPEVSAWLRERAAQDSRIMLLENAENLGFVGTVNRGMALSTSHDVLLLNSDTEVANDWLDRIRSAAYGDVKVASVTPFSNNATICSYPRFCQDNDLPTGYDTARLDALCAQTNPGAVVDVPTGVGFCMYIRRDCLAQVGLFDTDNFGKGYGEENDFCQRAAAAGWRNLHLLDTFVLHTGGVSFGDSKSPREQAAMQTLRRLHPRYESEVMAFVQADPANPYRLALDVARLAHDHLPVVLAVLHDRAGGTLRHVRELAEHLHAQARFLTLTPAPEHCVRLQMAGQNEAFELVFRLADQQLDLVLALRALGVCHIHYHHLLGHAPFILDLPQQLGVAYDFTAHDFYSYCTHISLTGKGNRYAGETKPGQCACCLPQDAAPGGGTVADWRHRNRHFLTGARAVLAPSCDTAQRIAAFAPGARVHAVAHTDVAHTAILPVATPFPRLAEVPLKVAVLGALSAIKGADVLEAVALEAAKRQAPVEFHLLGYAYRHLQTQPRAHLTVHGAYADEDLPGLLQWLQPDLVWFPAQWPETYSYTLSACLQAGLPIMAPELGAFTERLAGRPWSWLVRWDMEPRAWLDTFIALRERNFATGEPPAPPTPATLATAMHLGTTLIPDSWHYDSDYLPRSSKGERVPLLPLEFLIAHQGPRTGAGASAAKSALLSGVVWLRSHPLLRGLAKRIPQHWQTRAKNWLRA